jgi:hypothetical protein
MRKLKILQDRSTESPRSWDNLGTMALFSNSYQLSRTWNLGDRGHGIDHTDYNSFSEMERGIRRKHGNVIILPVYMYSHSGITISTEPFSCPWDSGQIGFIFVSKKKAREQMYWKKLTASKVRAIEGYLKSEVHVYDMYLQGDVYGFQVLDEEDNVIDSCWGFYGTDWDTNGIKGYLEEDLHPLLENVEIEY